MGGLMTGLHGEVGVKGGILTTGFSHACVRILAFNIRHDESKQAKLLSTYFHGPIKRS